jgi:hypothetical protein
MTVATLVCVADAEFELTLWGRYAWRRAVRNWPQLSDARMTISKLNSFDMPADLIY